MKSSPLCRRVLRIPAFLAGLTLVLAAGACDADGDRALEETDVLARVNANVITVAERDRARADLRAAEDLLGSVGDGGLSVESLDRLALGSLIDRQLMLLEARRLNLVVTRDELDEAVSVLRGRFADLESFGAWMNERGLDDVSLFRTVAEDILIRRVTAGLVEEAGVSEDQVREFYARHEEDLVIGREVRLAIIVLGSREEAEAILRALRDGFDFHRLAREHSIGKLAARGGDTGWIEFSALPDSLKDVVAGLREGEASRPVQKNEHEHLIVALAASRPVYAATLAEARDEIERRLLRTDRERTLAAWLRERKEEASIEILAQGR